jgi:replicative DNA helicase
MTDEEVRRFAFAGPSSPATVDFRNLPNEPRNPAAESATLGALMLSKACADALLPVLQTEHFTSRPHQDTLEAIRAVHASGRPVDPILVNDQLRRAGRLAWGNVKAATFIHTCMEATYFPGHGSSYAATVIECATRRRVLKAGIRIAQAAARGTGELPDLMRLVASEIHAVADEVAAHEGVRTPQRQPIRLAAAVDEAIPKLASTQQRAIDDVSL